MVQNTDSCTTEVNCTQQRPHKSKCRVVGLLRERSRKMSQPKVHFTPIYRRTFVSFILFSTFSQSVSSIALHTRLLVLNEKKIHAQTNNCELASDAFHTKKEMSCKNVHKTKTVVSHRQSLQRVHSQKRDVDCGRKEVSVCAALFSARGAGAVARLG